MREHIALWNQNIDASSADRDAAIAQWQQQNAARFQQVQQLAEQLAETGGN